MCRMRSSIDGSPELENNKCNESKMNRTFPIIDEATDEDESGTETSTRLDATSKPRKTSETESAILRDECRELKNILWQENNFNGLDVAGQGSLESKCGENLETDNAEMEIEEEDRSTYEVEKMDVEVPLIDSYTPASPRDESFYGGAILEQEVSAVSTVNQQKDETISNLTGEKPKESPVENHELTVRPKDNDHEMKKQNPEDTPEPIEQEGIPSKSKEVPMKESEIKIETISVATECAESVSVAEAGRQKSSVAVVDSAVTNPVPRNSTLPIMAAPSPLVLQPGQLIFIQTTDGLVPQQVSIPIAALAATPQLPSSGPNLEGATATVPATAMILPGIFRKSLLQILRVLTESKNVF